ncbi:unnamed protein product [Musa acuminata var. zebrina]
MRKPSQSSAPGSSTMAAMEVEDKQRRGPTPCCGKVGLKRGPWTSEEDEVLASFVRREGEGRWRTLPKRAGLLRCGKSCRLRWMNYLRPSIKHGPIAPDEEDLILRLHRLLGNRWSLIAGRIPGRTDNEIKNYWNTHLSKKLVRQGIDPRNHKPLATSVADAIHPPISPQLYRNPNPSAIPSNAPTLLRAEDTQKNFSDTLNLQQNDDDQEGGNCDAGEDGGIGIECYTDDIFSSFLDSNNSDGSNQRVVPAAYAYTAPSVPAYELGTFWEDDLMAQTGIEEDVHEQFTCDYKEGYYIGVEVHEDDPQAEKPFYGPNLWPSADILPRWRETMERYHKEALRVARAVARIIALALDLDAGFFDKPEMLGEAIATLRLLHYEGKISNPDKGVFGAGAHSDYGLITLLATDDVAGLQICKDRDAKPQVWEYVAPVKGGFIVNLGDMLERWSNCIFRSTIHRVVLNGRERYSIAYFVEPSHECLVECLPTCKSETNPPKFPAVTCSAYLLQRYKDTHADLSTYGKHPS